MPTLPPLDVPLIAAPMAGGPSTPALVAAVAEAGAMGFLAGGYLTAEAFDEQLTDLRSRSDRPFGANLFLPAPPDPDPGHATARAAAVRDYGARLQQDAARHGVELGEPRIDDDAVDAKIAVLARHRPAVVSVTFALPSSERYAALRDTGACLVATVTSVAEARAAEVQGVDALWVQGREAGGHRGVHVDPGGDPEAGAEPLERLLPAIRTATDLPIVAAGGLHDGRGIARMLALGATAVGLGTAFLGAPEAGTSATHRAALRAGGRDTVVTRAFTGRPARALVNRFTREHSTAAPAAYPELHHLTRPLRAAASRAGDAEAVHLWAGTGYHAVTEEPAGEVVARLDRERRAADGNGPSPTGDGPRTSLGDQK
ncbi:NAD(P)H-dependent flavin oxidoreductase [Actinomycetospora straminea]|uniref:Propionate 3-nitronate monooxygenase n=1 Tax=Actinomycetospora straminea TaxID=663607 RepID=A0ABP9DZJ2_9PSEU|nr:nitronate monooxygenase [Actinomycetospora straminea]MDD7932337.1 nitronate monooxygenase [Actinomycetospora straminea]